MCSSRSVSPAWTTPSTNSWISTPMSPGKTLLPASFSSASVSSTRSTLHFGPMAKPVGEKLIVDNRRARHDYHLLDRVEAGLVLTGTEVKALREGKATLQQAYADVRDGEAWLVGLHVPEYGAGNRENHEPDRRGKLLRDKRRAVADRDARRQIERELKSRR